MSIALIGEKWDSRNASIGWQNKKADLKVLLSCSPTDSDDDTEVQAYGDTYSGSYATTYNLIFQGYDMEPLGAGFWLLTVHYANREPKNPNDSTYNFEIGTTTVKATQSISTVHKYPNTAGGITTAPNHNGAIGVTSDGIEGCDIFAATFAFSETHYLPVASVNSTYQAALSNVCGKVNDSTWRGYAEGSVLFLGASGTQRGLDDWEITYKFQVRPGLSSQTIGPFTGISQQGWQYLWIQYTDAKDPDAVPLMMVKKPIAAYVEQVYYEGDFTTIGIGS
ncbi:MAG TPA: hypothetical protein VHX65_01525 [Pirellulales bacterium]|jgi:hypothetical protein|nr:hypothetical protein [Pirellulales bacterium]